jgi:hypothetical protein
MCVDCRKREVTGTTVLDSVEPTFPTLTSREAAQFPGVRVALASREPDSRQCCDLNYSVKGLSWPRGI